MPYFSGHNRATYFTFYTTPKLIGDGNTIQDSVAINGIITSRPVHIKTDTLKLDVNYVDYLCVDKSKRKQGLAQQLIQTHNYNQCRNNPTKLVSLFKREGELTGIVPLCVYNTYGYSVVEKPSLLSAIYKLVEINKSNYRLVHDFLERQTQFDITMSTEMANTLSLLETGNIFIYVVLQGDAVINAYWFRKSCVTVAAGKEALMCYASICKDANTFVDGFKLAFCTVAEQHNFGYAVVEDTSNNDLIIRGLAEKPTIISPTAYFLYNFVYPTCNANKMLILL
jgi:hypothetical protein